MKEKTLTVAQYLSLVETVRLFRAKALLERDKLMLAQGWTKTTEHRGTYEYQRWIDPVTQRAYSIQYGHQLFMTRLMKNQRLADACAGCGLDAMGFPSSGLHTKTCTSTRKRKK